ncbi:MAG: hypothetical protein WEE89_02225 [Gemmatimonadota bacterium]
MRYSLRAVLALTGVILLAACAEQEMDLPETSEAAHAPAAAPSTPADTTGGHDAHGVDSVATTTSH